jgi:hypothetical protein
MFCSETVRLIGYHAKIGFQESSKGRRLPQMLTLRFRYSRCNRHSFPPNVHFTFRSAQASRVGKGFYDETSNDRTYNDRTYNDKTYNDRIYNDKRYNDKTSKETEGLMRQNVYRQNV